VFAKDSLTASALTRAFSDKKIEKLYFGLSTKKPKKKKQGWVKGNMVRSRGKSWMLTKSNTGAEDDSTNNYAVTRFFTASMNNNDNNGNPKTVIMFQPFTGKTHQLRVAAKAMGIPLMGDPIYKSSNVDIATDSERVPLSRMMLHATGIHIPALHENDESINIWCPPPFSVRTGDVPTNNIGGITDEDMEACGRRVDKLMTKHCDVPGILQAMMAYSQNKDIISDS
jgi:23S rRNA-/tRNA-specific pseudouridylate synthase